MRLVVITLKLCGHMSLNIDLQNKGCHRKTHVMPPLVRWKLYSHCWVGAVVTRRKHIFIRLVSLKQRQKANTEANLFECFP